MIIDNRISLMIQEKYPPRGDIKEPRIEIFKGGDLYSSDPDHWNKIRERALELGETIEKSFDLMYEWDKKNTPNLLWLWERRLFISNKVILTDKREKEIELKFSKLNLTLLILFLRHDGYIDRKDLDKAKTEIQEIYTGLGRERSRQVDREEEDWIKRNDWFSKLVTAFNSTPDLDASEEERQRCPSEYGIRISMRNAKYNCDRATCHDYELNIPYEVHIGKDELKRFRAKRKRRQKDIELERTLVNPFLEQRLRNQEAIRQRARQSWIIDEALRLGKLIEEKEPSTFEKWYRNDNLRRIIVSYGTSEYYLVQNGKETPIGLPAQQLALLLLFARHKEGLTLLKIRQDKAISSELSEIYHLIKGRDKKDFCPDSPDETHPNAKLLDLISRINKKGPSIKKTRDSDDYYCITDIYELIELPVE